MLTLYGDGLYVSTFENEVARQHGSNILRENGVNEMAEKLTTYDPAEDLSSTEAIATFMAEAFQTNDAGYIAHALGVVARAKGMAQIAGQTRHSPVRNKHP